MKRLRSTRTVFAILGVALLSAVAAALLPDDPYQRSQLLDDTIHRKARWVYERTHFDPAPIDVLVVGPSRIGAAVNAPQLGQALAARGLPAHVVNFSFPEAGRDINYAILEEVLETKRPKLVIVGVIEQPGRYGHSAFKYMARPGLIADPVYAANFNYPANLMYLPFRQMKLFLARLAPGAMGLSKSFDPKAYPGSTYNTTGDITLPDGTVREGDTPAAAAELDRGVRKLEASIDPQYLPESMADIEFGDERFNIRRMAALADRHGAKLAFLALPYYTGPTTIQERAFYGHYGPVWNAGFLSPHAEWFMDYGHLTSGGAQVLTDWLAPRAAAELERQGKSR